MTESLSAAVHQPTIDETIAFLRDEVYRDWKAEPKPNENGVLVYPMLYDKSGEPTYCHPEAVMHALNPYILATFSPEMQEQLKLAALLHDVIEDTHSNHEPHRWTVEKLLMRGYPLKTLDIVKNVTSGIPDFGVFTVKMLDPSDHELNTAKEKRAHVGKHELAELNKEIALLKNQYFAKKTARYHDWTGAMEALGDIGVILVKLADMQTNVSAPRVNMLSTEQRIQCHHKYDGPIANYEKYLVNQGYAIGPTPPNVPSFNAPNDSQVRRLMGESFTPKNGNSAFAR